MEIVAPKYRKTKTEVLNIVNNIGDDEISSELLLMIDYAFHNTDNDYDDGLSFLNRLYSALSTKFQLTWNVNNLKTSIKNSKTPSIMIIDILNEILTTEMMDWYGL